MTIWRRKRCSALLSLRKRIYSGTNFTQNQSVFRKAKALKRSVRAEMHQYSHGCFSDRRREGRRGWITWKIKPLVQNLDASFCSKTLHRSKLFGCYVALFQKWKRLDTQPVFLVFSQKHVPHKDQVIFPFMWSNC